jgi:uncharacterized protein
MTLGLATLVLGLLIGYLGQRSRLCFISGYRDLLLMRDRHLLKGVFGTLLGALIGYALFQRIGGAVPLFPLLRHSDLSSSIKLTPIVIGGLGMGFVGALAGGCPFRMHVLAAEGKRTYWFYLMGFYLGLVLFEIVPLHRIIGGLLRSNLM